MKFLLYIFFYSICNKKPTNINKTKIILFGFKNEIDEIAGPGHKPANPHPAPNNPDPKKFFINIFIFNFNKIFCKNWS